MFTQVTFRIGEPNEVGRTQPYAYHPEPGQTLPPERTIELFKSETGGGTCSGQY